MLVIGAKGFAKEVLEILHQKSETHHLCFYDDVNSDAPNSLFGKFQILKSEQEALDFFQREGPAFVIGIGNPLLRKKLYDRFTQLGGKCQRLLSPQACIGNYGNIIESGVILSAGTIITNDITIRKGSLINLGCTIGHDSVIGEFVEICPHVSISGHCNIGDFSFLGTGAVILPHINIGKNAVVAAGAVVTKDIPDYALVAGAPAEIKKYITPVL